VGLLERGGTAFHPEPTDNAIMEAFNSRFRQECLNEHWFLPAADAQERV
jgi:putative transposase